MRAAIRRLCGAALLLAAFLNLSPRPLAALDIESRDAFILALTWYPGFCQEAGGADRQSCRSPSPFAAENLILHGLWPNWDVSGDHRYRSDEDDYCAGDRKTALAWRKAGRSGDWQALPEPALSPETARQLRSLMPGIERGLDRYEYAKHGTCTGLSAEAYFARAIALTRSINAGALAALIRQARGTVVARRDLLSAFVADHGEGSLQALLLLCRGKNLIEIRIGLAGRRDPDLQSLYPIFDKRAAGCPAFIFIPAFAPAPSR